MMTIEDLEKQYRELEVEQEKNKALRENILSKLNTEFGLEDIEAAKKEVERLKQVIANNDAKVETTLNEIKEMIDEYK